MNSNSILKCPLKRAVARVYIEPFFYSCIWALESTYIEKSSMLDAFES